MCVCLCVCVYIYTYPSNLFFPSWYFSPSLPLQAAVAAAANTSSVTSATAGATGVPGGHPQGAPGSHSPGPASYNILSVNEGTDWTDGYLLGKFLQSYSFSVTYLSLEIFCFLDLLSYLPFFCLTFSSLSPSHLYSYIFISPPLHSFFCLFSCLLSCSWCHHSSFPSLSLLHQLFISLPFFSVPILLGSHHLISLSLHLSCFFLQPVLDFHLRCLAPVYCHVFVLVSVHSAVCLFICLSVIAEFRTLSNQSVEEIESFRCLNLNAEKYLAQELWSDLVTRNKWLLQYFATGGSPWYISKIWKYLRNGTQYITKSVVK